ncbi:MAG: hypothetical protein JXR19_06070 [Bacteroidia bacterium]
MNLQLYFFKLSMAIFYVLRLSVLFLPLTILAVYSKQGGWKYGFTFIQNSLDVGLFIALAMGFMLGMYHVLSYELIGKGPNENYLRSNQNVKVKSHHDLDFVLNAVGENRRYSVLEQSDSKAILRKKVYFMQADHVTIERSDAEYTLKSRPHYKWWFLDFGRNFKTVTELAKILKRKI